jgi:two-component system response regulator MprA
MAPADISASFFLPRILVIEDNDDLRNVMMLVLGRAGWRAAGARDGRDALVALASGPLPDVIVLDLALPFLDGPTFRWRLLTEPAWAKIPILVCSANDEAIALRGLPAIARWLRKPICATVLTDAVEPYREAS